MTRQKSSGAYMFKAIPLALVSSALISFFLLLNYYDDVLVPVWPDEILFIQPAQNLAEGKGMGTPVLDELLPSISQRTYWQPPVYFLALATWGALAGFDIGSIRLLSRVCGLGVLVLLWLLALRWGVHTPFALMCVVWTALDLSFQYNSNIGRMDTMSALWLMACLLTFTAYQRGEKSWQAGTAGFFAALATLTHFITIPAVLTLMLVLSWRKRWRDLLWFLSPLALGWGMWLIYAAQDWQSFLAQLGYQFARKAEAGLTGKLRRLLSTPSLGAFTINPPPIWFAFTLASVLMWLRMRKAMLLRRWQLASMLAICCSAGLGGEMWYIGWFAPFGYLVLSVWLHRGFQTNRQRFVLWGLCVLWCCYQGVRVGQALSSVQGLKTEISRFYAELTQVLPKDAQVLLLGFPDPSPALQQRRPDLRLIQLSPTPVPPESLKRTVRQSDFFVGLTREGQRHGVPLNKQVKEWHFHASSGSWAIGLYDLAGGGMTE